MLSTTGDSSREQILRKHVMSTCAIQLNKTYREFGPLDPDASDNSREYGPTAILDDQFDDQTGV